MDTRWLGALSFELSQEAIEAIVLSRKDASNRNVQLRVLKARSNTIDLLLPMFVEEDQVAVRDWYDRME